MEDHFSVNKIQNSIMAACMRADRSKEQSTEYEVPK